MMNLQNMIPWMERYLRQDQIFFGKPEEPEAEQVMYAPAGHIVREAWAGGYSRQAFPSGTR